jgi:actin-related protein
MENDGVVIDLGSGVTKVGFSGGDYDPRSWFPTVVGRKRAGLEGIEYLNPIGTCAGD